MKNYCLKDGPVQSSQAFFYYRLISGEFFYERRSRPILGASSLSSVVILLFRNNSFFHYGWCDAEAIFGFRKHKKPSSRCEYLWGAVI